MNKNTIQTIEWIPHVVTKGMSMHYQSGGSLPMSSRYILAIEKILKMNSERQRVNGADTIKNTTLYVASGYSYLGYPIGITNEGVQFMV